MRPPCFNCQDRELGCHSRCEKYKAFKEITEQARLENLKLRPVKEVLIDHNKRSIEYKARAQRARWRMG